MGNGSFLFDLERFKKFAHDNARRYQSAEPFPHIVEDGLFPAGLLDEVLEEFPPLGAEERAEVGARVGKKRSVCDERALGETTLRLIQQLNSAQFIGAVETLTGIQGLIPDPHLFGGGLHETLSGGSLKMHIDFNRHERLRLDRRLNLLIYLNKDWEEGWGGHFELWDKEIANRKVRLAPLFNRLALFSTSEISWHGHPDPLCCPPERSRKSLALYYYTNGRPASETVDSHSTVFRRRPGDPFTAAHLQEGIKRFIPPIFLDIWRGLRGG